MKILMISDEEEKGLWDYYRPGKLADIDLILSAGDLKPEYLSFLVTMARCPVFYIHGNHDGIYDTRPPEGCDCIDDKLVTYKGLRILGLGGCCCYNHGPYQYTERQMKLRLARMTPKLLRAGGVDIILTHAPVLGYGDEENPAHRGFECFVRMVDRYQPAILVHGHVHKSYKPDFQRELVRGDTRIINCCGSYRIELDENLISSAKLGKNT